MNAITKTIVAAGVLLSSAQASASPLHPKDAVLPPLPNLGAHQNEFVLLVDSDPSVRVLYYIPRAGFIAVDAPRSTDPRPRFSVSHRVQSGGYFVGDTLSYLGGSMSTMGSLGALSELERDAAAVGYRIAPAPVDQVSTRFMITSRALVADDSGQLRIDLHCEMETIGTRTDGRPVTAPKCATKSDPDGEYDLFTELMYKFVAQSYTGSTVGGRIPFQGITVPGWDVVIDEKLDSGAAWDDLITSNVEWRVAGDRRTHKAVLTVNWESLFEQASAFTALHAGGCIDIEIEAFFQNITSCQGTAEACGVSVQWFDAAGQPMAAPSNNAEFVQRVNVIKERLEDELFAQVQPDSSVLGRVRRDTSAFYTLRANYEKRMMSRNEKIQLYWNPGSEEIKANTVLNIDCVRGTAGSRLFWNNSDNYCRSLLGAI